MKKHLTTIVCDVIPHKLQNYETCGNYTLKKDITTGEKFWNIEVSKTNADMEFLILIHEIVELYLTQRSGIREKDITKFDIEFEKNRKPGNTDEPGDDKNAPYRKEHKFATKIERMVAKELGVDWGEYEDTINKL